MDTTVTWIIIALFYAPLHYLVPALVVLIRSGDAERHANLRHAVLDCTLSMLVSFSLVIWLVGQQRITAAMLVLLLSMALPYVRILRPHPKSPEQDAPGRDP